MLLDHLVIDAEKKEGCNPLADEECSVRFLFLDGVDGDGSNDGSQR